MQDFSGKPLVLGSIRGFRRFNINEQGHLLSPLRDHMWYVGENTSVCWLKDIYNGEYFEHDMEHCACGFYAYTDLSSDTYRHLTPVSAVIEGYGETHVGTRGFRSTKAKLLAVCVDENQTDPLFKSPAKLDKMSRALCLIGAVCAVISIVMNIINPASHSPVLIGAMFAIMLLNLNGLRRRDPFSISFFTNECDPSSVEEMKKIYADIPFYEKVDDMLADFPLGEVQDVK